MVAVAMHHLAAAVAAMLVLVLAVLAVLAVLQLLMMARQQLLLLLLLVPMAVQVGLSKPEWSCFVLQVSLYRVVLFRIAGESI
jgi:hypothetical protein